MGDLYLYTIFDASGRPRCTGVRVKNDIRIYDLFRPGEGKKISKINAIRNMIRDLILQADARGARIVTSDFKSYLSAFDLPLRLQRYNVYDLHLPDIRPPATRARDHDVIRAVLARMPRCRLNDYQKLIANSAVVYQDMQNRGLYNNYIPVKPIWSQKTFSGRSKTTGFNIQTFADKHFIIPDGDCTGQVLIHFDWICADIRVASLMSDDERLERAFDESDPYTCLMEALNTAGWKATREECKSYLLRSINSMDVTSEVFQLYEGLGNWLRRCRAILYNGNGCLETLLHRQFRVCYAKNQLAVLNGIMQGSVAHAMQAALRRVWERLGGQLVAEIHDSLVVCSRGPDEVRATIDIVAPIMLRPLTGLLPSDPVFPFKLSIGKRWRDWKLFAIYRRSGVQYVTARSEAPGYQGTTSEAQEAAAAPLVEVTAETDGQAARDSCWPDYDRMPQRV